MDFEKLREDLIDYFGTAVACGNFAAIIDLSAVENASFEKLLQIALKNNFDLSKYETNTKKL